MKFDITIGFFCSNGCEIDNIPCIFKATQRSRNPWIALALILLILPGFLRSYPADGLSIALSAAPAFSLAAL